MQLSRRCVTMSLKGMLQPGSARACVQHSRNSAHNLVGTFEPRFRGSGDLKSQATRRCLMSASAIITRRRVRHILLPLEEAHLLESLQAELQNSGDASFGKLAERHSICPTAGRGGEIGWISPGTGLPAQLEEAIFEADINEPFTADSPGGVHLLQVMEERKMAEMQNMDVQQLAERLSGPGSAQFIDVREPREHAIANLPHFQLLPLSRFDEWRRELKQRFDMEKPTICLCHAGMRSRRLAELLLEEGFQEVYNVVGGIDAYSLQIDRKVPRY